MTASIPTSIARELRQLGADLRLARIKRRLRLKDVAGAAGVTVQTIQRLEAGEPGVALGTLATALMVLGLNDRLRSLAEAAKDDIGLLADIARLPVRVVRTRRANPTGR